MSFHVRILAAVLLASTYAACASAPAKPAATSPPRPPGSGQVEVTVSGVGNEKGQVLIALFLDERGWPSDQSRAFGTRALPVEGGPAVASFPDVPAGPFAVSVFHDENGDLELDTGLFGIPTEDYGFSRGARGAFGPPSFDDARLELGAGENRQITIQVK
jgi:uncharacterized protein (DUF2141 family)